MISTLYSHNSASLPHKKSLPKKDSYINHQFNIKTSISNNVSKQKITTSNKHLFQNQVTYQNMGFRNVPSKSNQILFNNNKSLKSRSCQNSTQKIPTKNAAFRTVYVGSATNRTMNKNNVKKTPKMTDKQEFEHFGTQIPNSKQKNFFYQGNITQKISDKISDFKWKSKELASVKLQKKNPTPINQKGFKIFVQPLKWNQDKIPYKYKQVLQKYSHYLTKYQMNQIKQYKNIYYIGHKISKQDKLKHQSTFNTKKTEHNQQSPKQQQQALFDNKQNQYVYQINDHIAYRYEIVQKMGKGSYGQVVKVFDHKKKQFVALKIVRNKAKFNQQAFIQIQILTHIKEKDTERASNVVRIKDFIIFRKHVCIVFQLLSQNLYELIIRNNYNGISPELIRRFAIQMLSSLQFLRNENIIHCDLKPQNILLREYNKSGIKIIDLGSSCFKNQTKYTYIQSRYYRAPEITLGIKYGQEIDMWSTGCILGELYTGIPLFPGENQREQMKYFVNTLGYPPRQFIARGQRTQIFFDMNGQPNQAVNSAKSIDHFEKPLRQRINDVEFCQFLQGFLRWQPQSRFTPLQAMNYRWIRQGLPPQISKILPTQRLQQRKKSSKSIARKINTRSQQRERQESRTRIKKGSQILNHNSKQLRYLNKD